MRLLYRHYQLHDNIVATYQPWSSSQRHASAGTRSRTKNATLDSHLQLHSCLKNPQYWRRDYNYGTSVVTGWSQSDAILIRCENIGLLRWLNCAIKWTVEIFVSKRLHCCRKNNPSSQPWYGKNHSNIYFGPTTDWMRAILNWTLCTIGHNGADWSVLPDAQ